MTRYYRIASVTVRVDQDWQEELPLFEGFACAEEPQEADIRVRLFAGEKLFEPCYGVSFLRRPCAALFCSQEFRRCAWRPRQIGGNSRLKTRRAGFPV